MMSWCSCVTFQVSSTNFSRPISLRLVPRFFSCFSTTCCVAMPGVIGARDPQGVVPDHAVVADLDVLQGVVQAVPHVQDAGDVGRRDDDDEPLLSRLVDPAGAKRCFSIHRA